MAPKAAGEPQIIGAEEDLVDALWDEDEVGPYNKLNIWTMNEIRDHPLFMPAWACPEKQEGVDQNPYLLALQDIIYGGKTPDELAEHFKQMGNDAFKLAIEDKDGKGNVAAQNALMAYTKALEMEPTDKKLLSIIHSNRSAVSMRLGMNDKALDDCRKAIKADPTNLKAIFRGGKASEDLGLYAQAQKFCTKALELTPADSEVKKLQSRLKKQLALLEEEQRKVAKREEEARKLQKELGDQLLAILKPRDVVLDKPLFDISMYRLQGATVLPKPHEGHVIWPMVFAYDEFGQSDFVQAFDEECALQDQLQMMFPEDRNVEWDPEHRYVWHDLVAYMEVYDRESSVEDATSMVKVPIDMPLVEKLKNFKLPHVLIFHVFVYDSAPLKAWLKSSDVHIADDC